MSQLLNDPNQATSLGPFFPSDPREHDRARLIQQDLPRKSHQERFEDCPQIQKLQLQLFKNHVIFFTESSWISANLSQTSHVVIVGMVSPPVDAQKQTERRRR